jgi:hypothetical protein
MILFPLAKELEKKIFYLGFVFKADDLGGVVIAIGYVDYNAVVFGVGDLVIGVCGKKKNIVCLYRKLFVHYFKFGFAAYFIRYCRVLPFLHIINTGKMLVASDGQQLK